MIATNSTHDDTARVLVVDGHRLVREGIAARLSNVADLHVVGEAEDWETAVAEIERLSPDTVLLAAHLDDGSGLDLARLLATRHPRLVVVLHTTADLTNEQFENSRAAAVVLKQLIGDTLVQTLRGAVHGSNASEPCE